MFKRDWLGFRTITGKAVLELQNQAPFTRVGTLVIAKRVLEEAFAGPAHHDSEPAIVAFRSLFIAQSAMALFEKVLLAMCSLNDDVRASFLVHIVQIDEKLQKLVVVDVVMKAVLVSI